ncbi:MAG TPA: hypothetical protein VHF06_35380 [Pseudonocardiaceae bacterium]|jgi:hypothetical protein|nr:hypothetical protein [Pseudonocardiaceae bacterium]
MDERAAEMTSDLVDLDGMSLAALDSYNRDVLTQAAEHLLRQIDNPTTSVAGHSS